MSIVSNKIALESFEEVQEYYHSRGWTDGFPIVPPTSEAVQACLDWAYMRNDELIGIEPVRERPITAEKLAISAVMAGCLPIHFPVIVSAWSAMLKEEFLLHGATASTGGCAVFMVLNGPIRKILGCENQFNASGVVIGQPL